VVPLFGLARAQSLLGFNLPHGPEDLMAMEVAANISISVHFARRVLAVLVKQSAQGEQQQQQQEKQAVSLLSASKLTLLMKLCCACTNEFTRTSRGSRSSESWLVRSLKESVSAALQQEPSPAALHDGSEENSDGFLTVRARRRGKKGNVGMEQPGKQGTKDGLRQLLLSECVSHLLQVRLIVYLLSLYRLDCALIDVTPSSLPAVAPVLRPWAARQ
jgi:hypothetical protein